MQSAHRGHRNDVNIIMSCRKGIPTNWLTGQTSAETHDTEMASVGLAFSFKN